MAKKGELAANAFVCRLGEFEHEGIDVQKLLSLLKETVKYDCPILINNCLKAVSKLPNTDYEKRRILLELLLPPSKAKLSSVVDQNRSFEQWVMENFYLSKVDDRVKFLLVNNDVVRSHLTLSAAYCAGALHGQESEKLKQSKRVVCWKISFIITTLSVD